MSFEEKLKERIKEEFSAPSAFTQEDIKAREELGEPLIKNGILSIGGTYIDFKQSSYDAQYQEIVGYIKGEILNACNYVRISKIDASRPQAEIDVNNETLDNFLKKLGIEQTT